MNRNQSSTAFCEPPQATGRGPSRSRAYALFLLSLLLAGSGSVAAQASPPPVPAEQRARPVEGGPAQRGVSDWLARMHEGSRRRAYVGTFVVSSGASIASSRIWHVCDGASQVERVESLTGAPRSTFRRNDQVITFLPESREALAETRESLGLFPNLLGATESSIAEFYRATVVATERVAGFDCDVVQLQPKDRLRFGYRIWSESRTGLVIKMQTLDVDGQVLEQAAFSELQLDAPVSMQKLTRMMASTDGYEVKRPELVRTTALAEGWLLKGGVPGFKPMSCYRRAGSVLAGGSAPEETMQWIFSDGLASVSIFVEPADARRHGAPGSMAIGATRTLTKRIVNKSSDKAREWWLTVVGEVPGSTLALFVQGLERSRPAPR